MLNDSGLFCKLIPLCGTDVTKSDMYVANNGPSYVGSNNGALTEDQKYKLDRISQRDAEFDKTLDAINSAVDRAGSIAKQIGEEAEKQVFFLNPYLFGNQLEIDRIHFSSKWMRKLK